MVVFVVVVMLTTSDAKSNLIHVYVASADFFSPASDLYPCATARVMEAVRPLVICIVLLRCGRSSPGSQWRKRLGALQDNAGRHSGTAKFPRDLPGCLSETIS